jgi:hypothetical protein
VPNRSGEAPPQAHSIQIERESPPQERESPPRTLGRAPGRAGSWSAPNAGGVAVLEDGVWRHIGGGTSRYATRLLVQADALLVVGYFSAVGASLDGDELVPGVPSHGMARFVFTSGE